MKNLLRFGRVRKARGKKWKHDPLLQPWFDQPDALGTLEGRRRNERLSDEEFEALRSWVENGYAVVSDIVPVDDIDRMQADLDNVWTTNDPIEGLVIEDLRVHPEDPPGIAHPRLVTLDRQTRERIRRECHWRIHGFANHSESTERIFRNAELIRLASLVFGRDAVPCYTINFSFGSAQSLHQDTAVFAVVPMNYLLGAWLACEDVDPDSGPLVFYPGSHKESLFPAFDNYPQTNLKTCPLEMMDEYYRYLGNVASRYERKAFIAKKGDLLIWHGMLIHGGDTIRNPSLTRKSYVCHYIPPGLNKESEVEGPFNW